MIRRTLLALTTLAATAAAGAEAQTIDATQFCNRTQKVRATILESVSGATATCIHADPTASPPVAASYSTNLTASQLAGIRKLVMWISADDYDWEYIDGFKSGDFDGLTGVEELDLTNQSSLSFNGLHADGVPLSFLGRLKKLVLQDADIWKIENADYFRGLTNLEILWLGTNNMVYELPGKTDRPEGTSVGRRINPEAWRHLPNLRYLWIGSNRILTLPRGFFRHLTRLEELDMFDMWYEYHPYGFGSQALGCGIFQGLGRVKKLDLGYNALGAEPIQECFFEGLTGVEEIDLRENPLLETLPRSVLDLPAGARVLTDPGVTWPEAYVNTAPTGAPTLSGTPQSGETLTADTSAIADADGLSKATFRYQWIAHDGTDEDDIDGATEANYTLTDAEVGKTINVKVTFTDDEGTNETLTSAATETVTAAPPTMSVTGGSGAEGEDSAIVFTVTLDKAAAAAVSVDYATADGTATSGDDYTPTSGTLTFDAGTISRTISVPIADDESDENHKTFTLTLSNAAGANLGTSTATGTIRNRAAVVETTPTLGITGGSGTEGDDSSIFFTITLDEAATTTVTVDYATADGTATAGSDYTSTSGTLSFAAGTTSKTIAVPIADDETDESDETFTVTLSNTSGADLGTATATGTIRNRTPAVETTPTVSITGGSAKEGDDTSITFTVTLDKAASARVTVDYATADGTAEAGDDYTAASGTLSFGAGATSRTISVEIEDDIVNESDETFTVTLSNPSGAELGTSTATGTIRNRHVEPLTARFENMPAEHDGSEFTFELHFSENVKTGFRRVRDHAFALGKATINEAKRQHPQAENRNQSWTIRVQPTGAEEAIVMLPAGADCTDHRSICTFDGRKLSHDTWAAVAGPPSMSVADARVTEAAGAVLAFTVTLSRASGSNVSVDFQTADGTATAGADYTAASGTLTIDAGETSGTIEVAVLDDSHDDGGETLTLTLSNPTNGTLADATATGTIDNADALPTALVARFGRTAALHVVETVEERVSAPRARGFDGRVAGRRIHRGMGKEFALGFLQRLGGRGGAMHAAGVRGVTGGMTSSLGPQGRIRPQGMRGNGMQGASLQGRMARADGLQHDAGFGLGMGGRDQVLGGSAFALNRTTTTGGVFSVWSRSAQSSFYGQDGALALNGDVRSTMFGADYAKGRMVSGVSLAHTRGLGGYAGAAGSGRMTSAVTGLYPWIGFKANERVTVWTVTGYGAGGLLLDPGAGAPVETGMSMSMVAGGGRGELVETEAGFGLAFKADALWVGTRTDAASGASGKLGGTSAAVTRLRTAIEGSRSATIGTRIGFTPSVELGIRQDGGDAEVGRGLDIGLGLMLADGTTGLAVHVRLRRLLVHESIGFAESGMAVSVSYDPTPSTPLGISARVAPAWGGDAMSGANALWGRETMGGMGQNHLLGAGGNRLDTEVGYGLLLGARFVGTPRLGVRASEYGRDYRLGYGVEVLEEGRLNLQLGIDAERRSSPVFHLRETAGGTDQRVLGHATVQW